MFREGMTSLVADRRSEVLALIVLVNFALAFALASAIDAATTIQAGTFVLAFIVLGVGECVVARRWMGVGFDAIVA